MAKEAKEPKNLFLKQNLTQLQDDMQSLSWMAANAQKVLEEIKGQVLEPYPRKTAPVYTTLQVANLCGKTRLQLKNAEANSNIKLGTLLPGDNTKTYTLEEAIEAVTIFGEPLNRPPGKKGKVLTIANYKGGVGKTTAAVSIAQGLCLNKALKVLFIDLDPQGSGTTLFGISPQLEIAEDDTVANYFYRDKDRPNLAQAIQKTYWHNLDLIAASSHILGSEFIIPSNAMSIKGYKFWDQLNIGLEPLKEIYDVIVIDSSPSLGYLTQNAVAASDAILSPCPLDALDFASLSQFWTVFMEIAGQLGEAMAEKKYDFVGVFVSKAKLEKDEMATSNIVKGWLKKAFGERMWDITLPESTLIKTASAMLQTIYDVTDKKEMQKQSYKRYKEPMDMLVDLIAAQFNADWSKP